MLQVQEPTLVPARDRTRLLAVLGAILVIGVLGVYALARSRHVETEALPDAAVVVVAPPVAIDAAVVDALAVAEPPADATVDAAVAVAAPPDAGVKIRTPPKQAPDAGVVAPPALAKRKVTINAIPWANFTVDGDPRSHETVETIQLAPGPHTIHFENSVLGVQRDVAIDVPADRDITVVEPLKN
jgi:hypothetical protein